MRRSLFRRKPIRSFETLEPRVVLAGESVVISELMADNQFMLQDEDGDPSDWIELYNDDAADVNLDGWYVTNEDTAGDGSGDPVLKWQLPAVDLAAGQYLVLFASGKDRSVPGSELHTNFTLDPIGQYLALVRPDATVAWSYAPQYPPQVTNVSYGLRQETSATTLLAAGAAADVLVPPDDSLGTTWTAADYVPDASWTTGTPTGIGFDVVIENNDPELPVPLAIASPGFEDDLPALPNDYNYQNGIITGWEAVGSAGTFNPRPESEAGVQGQIVAFTNARGDTITQQLADTLQPEAEYTLTVGVGSQALGDRSYQVQLLAGGVVLAEDVVDSVSLGPGITSTATVQFTAPADHPQLGYNLAIVLDRGLGGSGQMLFDSVELLATPGSARAVEIDNASLENLTIGGVPVTLADGQFVHIDDPGNTGLAGAVDFTWTQSGGAVDSVGLYNPPVGDIGGQPPDGANLLFIKANLDPGYASNVLDEVLQADTTYTLAFRHGVRGGGNGNFQVGLYAGGTLLDEISGTFTGAPATFQTEQLVVNSKNYAAQVGGRLEIRIQEPNSSGQTTYDQFSMAAVDNPLTVELSTNGSFEQFTGSGVPGTLGNGQYVHFRNAGSTNLTLPIDVTGWTQVGGGDGGAGLYNPPATNYPGDVLPDGQNVLFLNDATYVSQSLAATLEADTTYILSAMAGAGNGDGGYDVGLYAGGTLLANVRTDNGGPDTVPNAFVPVELTIDSADYAALAGEPLEIRLGKSKAAQTHYDSVKLEKIVPDTAFTELIGTELKAAMYGQPTSAYVRVPFDVGPTDDVSSLVLRMKYDDGFVAYLNGVEIARASAPTDVAFDSSATADRPRDEAVQFQSFDLAAYIGDLLPDQTNVLAVQGLKQGAGDTDFLMVPELEATLATTYTADERFFVLPTPGTINGAGFVEIGPTELVINEIHYDPENNAEHGEFIELLNVGATDANLTGWRISGGVDFDFPLGTIVPAGGYLVVAEDPAVLLGQYGVSAVGPFTGRLNNDGERVRLRNAADEVADQVEYKQGFPWPVASAGEGSSMELIHPALDNDLGGSWRAEGPPTPGAENTAFATSAPPQTRQVKHNPQQPTSAESATITAKVTDPDGVASVELSYQVVAPGAYVPAFLSLPRADLLTNAIQDRTPNPAFEDPANWTTVVMADDGGAGGGGDALAGDDVYTATLPAQANRTLVRYRITVTDMPGASVRLPYADDSGLNFAYFVYDGVPDYVASASSVQPEGPGYVYASETLTSLPVYTLITDAADLSDAIAYDPADQIPKSYEEARGAFNWEGAFVFDGQVYDHINYRLRQANDRYGGSGKRSMRFRFNKSQYLQTYDLNGDPYPTKWRTLNTSKMVDNKRYGNFGLVETVNQTLWNLMGVPTPVTHPFHFRVIDGPEEAPADADGQYQGDFWGLGLAVEDYDARFLEAHDMAKGNLYKLKDAVFDGNKLKRYQGHDAVADDSDFQNIRNNLRPYQSAEWIDQNVNVDAFYPYWAMVEALRHYDFLPQDTHSKNRAWYFEPSETNPLGRLWTLPYDHDSTWGPTYSAKGIYTSDAIFDNWPNGDLLNDPMGPNSKPEFMQEFRNFIREFRDLVWNSEVINPLLDDLAAKIADFVPADRDRWRGAPASAGYQDFGPMEAKVQDMKNYAFVGWSGYGGPAIGPGGRAVYLDAVADLGGDAANVPNKPAVTSAAALGYPIDSLTFQTTPFSDPQGDGTFAAMQWRVAEVTDPTAPAYDGDAPRLFEFNASWTSGELATFSDQITIPIDAVTVGHAYRARVRMKDDTGRWSHWSDPVQFVVGPTENTQALMAGLRVTEINFNPHDPTPEERAVDPMLILDNDDFEFVELANVGLDALDLTEVAFTDGVQFPFATGAVTTLAPGERVLIVRDAAAFAVRYDTAGLLIAGEYRDPVDGSNKLSNSGEQLRIEGFGGTIIAEFEYNDTWYPQTDGEGFTLVAADPAGALDLWNRKDGWLPSHRAGGTPGAGPDAALVLPETIVVNEVSANSLGTPGDWIELANVGPSPVDVGGWLLSNSPLEPAMYRIAAPAVLAPGATLALTEAGHFGAASTDPGVILPFSLSPYGGTVYVAAADPVTGERLGYRSEQSFGASDLGVSLGRHVKSTGGKDFVALSTPTPDGPNALPLVGPLVINEIMYHPPYGEQEFIEIRNSSGTAVPLDDGQGNAWRLRGAIDFTFPLGQSIPAGGFALAIQGVDLGDAAAEADAFRTAYGVPVAVPIFVYTGLDNGSLSNDSEKLFLDRPGDPNSGLPVQPYILVDAVKYDDGTNDSQGWPVQADGAGSALGRIGPDLYGNDVANWAATAAGGSPGVANTFIDTTAPTVPEGLSATIADSSRVDLAWLPSSDPETGVDRYNVYRNDVLIGTSSVPAYEDSNVMVVGGIAYAVSAVNPDGVESERSRTAAVNVQTAQFQDGALPDASYDGTADTYMDQRTPDGNFGDSPNLIVDGSLAGELQGRILIRWDIGDVPADGTVLSASMDVQIYNSSGTPYYVYPMLRDWSQMGATWNESTAGVAWQQGGAEGPADHGNTVVATVEAGATGQYTIPFNAAGIALIQSWIDGSAENFGLLLANAANIDSMQFYSSEYATVTGNRPTLNVHFTPRPEATVVGRHVFYNNSAIDGNGPSTGAADDGAIATDKSALLPGDTATPINYTSFSRGMNGIMVDIDGLADPGGLSAADFEFQVGNQGEPSTWAAAPNPAEISVREGDGTNGSDRVTVTWANGAIQNQWLRVTALSDANGGSLGLAQDDVFYFGNAIGESGNSETDALVNTADVIAIRDNPRGPTNPASITDPFDLNRDRRVDAVDLILARDNATSPLSALRWIAPSLPSPVPLSPANAEGRLFPPAGEGESTFATRSSASTGTASLESLDGLMAAHAGHPAVDSLSLPSPLLGKLLRRLGSAI